MVYVRLGYVPKKKKWIELKNYTEPKYNNYLVVTIDRFLWKKVLNIIMLRKKGYDAIIVIDGKRRTGKSTLAQTIAYLLNPNMTVDNFVKGIEDAIETLDKLKEEDVIIFDESSLAFNSKDAMKKSTVQLLKVIDVIGQKRLAMICCLPEFFSLQRPISITHSLFLIHIYTDKKLIRGRFAYFGTKKKRMLYEIGKKNFNSYRKPTSDFVGQFPDFKLPFEEEYQKLKMDSLKEAMGIRVEKKMSFEQRKELILYFLPNVEKMKKKITNEELGILFGVSDVTMGAYIRGIQGKSLNLSVDI